MYRLFLTFMLVPVLLLPAGAKTYTLEELVETALKTSSEVIKVQEEMDKTASQVREAYGSALPSVDFSANYQYAWEQYSAFNLGGDTDELDQLIAGINPATEPGAYGLAMAFQGMIDGFSDIVKDQAVSLGFKVQGPLYAQGKVGIGLRIAKEYNTGLESKLRGAKLDVAGGISKLFYGALLARKNMEIMEETVRIAEESLRMARLRKELGKGNELDVLAAQLNLEKARADLTTARSNRQMANEVLIKQAGLDDASADFEVTGDFPEATYVITQEEALSRMKEGNQNLRQLETGEEIQNQLVKLARSDYFPMVYYGANLGKITQFNAGDDIEWYDNQNFYAGMSVNLFKGGQTMQKVKQAQNDREVFRQTKRQAEDGLELAVKNAYESLENSRSSLTSAGAIVALAEKGYGVAQKSYEVGLSTRLEMEDAELKLRGARLAENAALMAFTSAVIDMKILTNTLEIQ